eukprot:4949989-Lingulodinium_polyedra.AAC.1
MRAWLSRSSVVFRTARSRWPEASSAPRSPRARGHGRPGAGQPARKAASTSARTNRAQEPTQRVTGG